MSKFESISELKDSHVLIEQIDDAKSQKVTNDDYNNSHSPRS
jgi:hypothetical protein